MEHQFYPSNSEVEFWYAQCQNSTKPLTTMPKWYASLSLSDVRSILEHWEAAMHNTFYDAAKCYVANKTIGQCSKLTP